MPTEMTYKIQTKRKNLHLRVAKGHFATSHSHINYYIDITIQKSRLSEAREVARELASYYKSTTIVDTILCLDGTEVIGTCLANILTEANFMNMNAHGTIYVVTPEYTQGNQMIFRDSVLPMIEGKHVLILAASVATGGTAKSAIEAIRYYNGMPVGVRLAVGILFRALAVSKIFTFLIIYDVVFDVNCIIFVRISTRIIDLYFVVAQGDFNSLFTDLKII